ncbi:MAG TPA: capsule assembly Wzi family protein [Ferruginibacter sp.]|nr:capsule assembly Wzi family protein [Ferruginibacter sp.]HMP20853.1 capsule assembly Wzi family protein [Ferruginibacter sp.]
MAQSANLTQGDKIFHFIDRFEIKYGHNTDINFSTIKPLNRKYVVQEAEFFDSVARANPAAIKFSRIDQFNMRRLLMNNTEWVTGSKEDFKSERPILKYFYRSKPNLLEVNEKDFFLAINPVLNLQYGSQSGNDDAMFLNTRGATMRGLIARKIAFAASLTDNQERGPSYFFDKVNNLRAVPGVGFYKNFKRRAFDYFDARGYVAFNAAKYVDIQFGFDKNFIGNGYRSLFLSDWGNSYLFLKLNTKIWKFNYQNIFAEVMPQFVKQGDSLLDRKYMATHHLSVNVTKWLNIGLFETVMFGRKNNFDFQYLNPIIFYRHIEGMVGSPDNALAGIDFKANVAQRLQFYGQLLLDEFKLSQIRANTGWWANKWGLQLGAKYTDAFGVANLDVQVESNRVRPFTYSHNNIISNVTHYNQPLAHPLGANFQEFIGIIRYQPAPRWYVHARVIYYNQGLDSLNGRNYGGNPFRLPTDQRIGDFGYNIGSGRKATCLNALLALTYEPWENINIDLSLQQRNYSIANDAASKNNSTLITAGVRMNIFRREYDF